MVDERSTPSPDADPPPSRLEALFHAAADLADAERERFVREACGDDEPLRRELEELLRLDAEPTAIPLGSPPVAGDDAGAFVRHVGPMSPGVPFGRYRLLRPLGAGATGDVYEAEQDNPRRSVALKILRVAASTSLLHRFRREAEVLGRLHHPGIAQVHEAGSIETLAPDGERAAIPFIAMELVTGATLDVHASGRALGVQAKLGLVARVCDAVQHAHDHGVVHRDLKPANILVEPDGGPKILDFGIARLVGGGLPDVTAQTDIGQLLGTLPYMSPEQLSSDPTSVDGRSDVYAIGVILFELLANRLPYELRDRGVPEAIRVIQETPPERLPRSVGGPRTGFADDIATIVATALEKDPARRYPSAAALAADIRRHLADEPIRARPASAVYQFRKFARRHRALVGGVAAVIVALSGGVVGMTILAAKYREAAQVAAASERAARQALYRRAIAGAHAALDQRRHSTARGALAEAPKEERSFEWRMLGCAADRATLRHEADLGDDRAANPLHFVAAGAGVAVLDDRGTIHLLDPDTGRCMRRFRRDLAAGAGAIAAIGAAGPSDSLAIVGRGRGLTMWNLASGSERWRRDDAQVEAPTFTDDGARIATMIGASGESGEPASIAILDAATGAATWEMSLAKVGLVGTDRSPGEGVLAPPVLLAPDGSLVVIGDARRFVVIEPTTNRVVSEGAGHPLGLSADGSLLCVLVADGLDDQRRVRVVRMRDGYEIGAAPVEGVITPGQVRLIDDRRLAIADNRSTVTIWDVVAAEPVGVIDHFDSPCLLEYDVRRRNLVGLTWHRELCRWNVDEPLGATLSPRVQIEHASHSPDGATAATAHGRFVTAWDARTGLPRWTRYVPRQIGAMAIAPSGHHLAVGDLGGSVWRIDLDDGEGRTMLAHTPDDDPVTALAWASAGEVLLVGTRGGSVIEASTGVLAEGLGAILCIAMSADGGHVLVGSGPRVDGDSPADDATLRMIDRERRTCRWTRRVDVGDAVTAVAFAAVDGRQGVLFGTGHGRVELADALDGGLIRAFATVGSPITAVILVPTEPAPRWAAGRRDGAIVLWNDRGEQVLTIEEGRDRVHQLSFDLDSDTLLASAGRAAVMRFPGRRPAADSGNEAQRRAIAVHTALGPAHRIDVELAGEALALDASLLDADRAVAVAIVSALSPGGDGLAHAAWKLATRRDRGVEECEAVLRLAKRATLSAPHDIEAMRSLGLATFRLAERRHGAGSSTEAERLYKKAQSELAASMARGFDRGDHSHAGAQAVAAMIHHRLGAGLRARAALDRATANIVGSDPGDYHDCDALIAEARELLLRQ